MSRIITRLRYAWRRHSAMGLVPLLIYNIVYHVRKGYLFRLRQVIDPFDQKYGTDTSGISPIGSLDAAALPNARYAGPYGPSSADQASKLIARLNIDVGNFTFIDFGSGKG